MARIINFQWNEAEICLVIEQQAYLDFYSTTSLKQQSEDRRVTQLVHINLIPRQPVFALSP
jgi:hypothetical protein